MMMATLAFDFFLSPYVQGAMTRQRANHPLYRTGWFDSINYAVATSRARPACCPTASLARALARAAAASA